MMSYDIVDFTTFLGSGFTNLFGTGIILGIFAILFYFIIAYKFELPPIITLMVVATVGLLIGQSILGDWVRALVFIGIGSVIAILGYRILSG